MTHTVGAVHAKAIYNKAMTNVKNHAFEQATGKTANLDALAKAQDQIVIAGKYGKSILSLNLALADINACAETLSVATTQIDTLEEQAASFDGDATELQMLADEVYNLLNSNDYLNGTATFSYNTYDGVTTSSLTSSGATSLLDSSIITTANTSSAILFGDFGGSAGIVDDVAAPTTVTPLTKDELYTYVSHVQTALRHAVLENDMVKADMIDLKKEYEIEKTTSENKAAIYESYKLDQKTANKSLMIVQNLSSLKNSGHTYHY
jgi:hypothetical protein